MLAKSHRSMFIPPPLCTAGYNQLSSAAHRFLTAGLATSTTATYSAGKRRYLQFCGRAKVPATPASEATIILFVSHLATTNISHSSIKIYLSAVRHMHIIRGLHTSSSPHFERYEKKSSIHSPIQSKASYHNQYPTQDTCLPLYKGTFLLQHHALGNVLPSIFWLPLGQRIYYP